MAVTREHPRAAADKPRSPLPKLVLDSGVAKIDQLFEFRAKARRGVCLKADA
jgi:hypothetical protein